MAPVPAPTNSSDGSWVENTLDVPGLQSLGPIACASAEVCVVLGNGAHYYPVGIWSTADGGLEWNDQVPPLVADLEAVSCAPGTLSCWAVGRLPNNGGGVVDATTDGGSTWSAQTVPAAISALDAISCVDAEDCVAVGGEHDNFMAADVTTSDAGATWTAHAFQLRDADFLTGVSCGTALECTALGIFGGSDKTVIAGTSDGGVTFTEEYTQENPDYQYWTAISCAGTVDCWVSAALEFSLTPTGVVLATTNAGKTWTNEHLPGRTVVVAGLSCPSTTSCWATASPNPDSTPDEMMTTTDSGNTWEFAPAAVEQGEYNLSCPSASTCFATAGATDVVATRNATGTSCTGGTAGGSLVGLAPTPDGGGYWLATATGDVSACGDATFYGSPESEGTKLAAPIVAIAATGSCGYYELASDGSVYPFGPCTQKYPPVHSGSPFVGIAADPSSHGYWLVSEDGGVFAVGTHYHGSVPGVGVRTRAVVGIATAPTGGGYWVVASDGGVFSFGLRYRGSLPGVGVHVQDIVGVAASPTGSGYVLAGADGGVFAFGPGVRYCGSAAGHARSAVGSVATYPFSPGYWLVERSGLISSLDAPLDGSAALPTSGPTRCG